MRFSVCPGCTAKACPGDVHVWRQARDASKRNFSTVLPPISDGAKRTSKLEKSQGEPRNMQALGEAAGELKSDVVDPLRSSLTLTGVDAVDLKVTSGHTRGQIESAARQTLSPTVQGWTHGLGVTGGALGGVAGLSDVVTGLKEGDAPKTFSGATDVAVSASALASLGLIGGAAVLGPASTVLIGMRGLQNTQKDGRAAHLSAATDLLTAGMFCAKLLPVTAALPMALGFGATAVGLVKGLHSLKEGVEKNDVKLRAKGTGETLTAMGVALVSTGVAMGPGIALMLGGVALPLLQRLKFARKYVDKAVNWTAQKLYPMSLRSEAMLDRVAPLTEPAQKVVEKGKTIVAPVTQPLKELGRKAFHLAQKGVRWATGSWVATKLDEGVGHLNKVLLPEERASSSSPG